ncbi:MAG: BON domain-containing protein [Acidobacteriota bacterium]
MSNNTKVSWSVVTGFLSLTLLSLSLSLNGCATADSPAAKTGPTPAAQITNSELENKIKAKFSTDAQINAANLSVDANVDRNEITLSGTVGSESLRTKAVELAKSAHAGLIVTTKIDVKPGEISRAAYTLERAREERSIATSRGETIGDSLDDGWIHTTIVAQLVGNSTTPERKINVDVTNNVVTLRGTVETAEQKKDAEHLAKNTEGVKSVNNQLKVGTATEKK